MSQTPKSPSPESTGLQSLLRAFRHRNFRLYFSGQIVSIAGTLVQGVALSWVVYQLTGSALLLGLVGFAGQIPLFLLTPLAGVFVDRHSRHRILVITQTLSMVLALLLAALAYGRCLNVWGIVVLNVIGGVIAAIDMPSRQAFIADMVGNGPDLSNAVALNSFTFNGSRIIGPAVGGVLLAAVSPAFCFLLNGLSFIAVIWALLAMRLDPPQPRQNDSGPAHRELLEGFRYAWHSAPIRAILALVTLGGLMGAAQGVLMPVFAVQIFHGGPHILGCLIAVPGIGALAAGVCLAWRKTVFGAETQIAGGAILCGVGLLIFSQSRWLPLSLGASMLVGFGMVMLFALSNTVLQTLVDDDKRGRVMSLFSTSIMGMMPFGSLLGGFLAHQFGAPFTVAVCGLVCIAGGGYFALKLPALQRLTFLIYQQKGILPGIVK